MSAEVTFSGMAVEGDTQGHQDAEKPLWSQQMLDQTIAQFVQNTQMQSRFLCSMLDQWQDPCASPKLFG